MTCTLFHFVILYLGKCIIQYISIEDNAGGAKPPAPPLNSYANHHLIPQALYNDEIVIGCVGPVGFGIKPCGAPNLVIACGFSNGYKKNIRENMYVTPLSLRQHDQ